MATVQILETLDELKAEWLKDPHWDIEKTEGFEEHFDELKQFREEQESEWRRSGDFHMREKAAQLGCPNNVKLAEYVFKLERRLEAIEDKLYAE